MKLYKTTGLSVNGNPFYYVVFGSKHTSVEIAKNTLN